MKDFVQFRNVRELLCTLNTEEKCREYIAELRWKGKPECPHCNHNEKIYQYKDNRLYKCSSCKKQFTVTVGTIFHKTHIDLRDWFYALYVFANHKKGISSRQMAKDLGISLPSAWFLLQRIRQIMRERNGKLIGDVEIDETFIGGKNKNRHWDKKVKGNQGRALIDKAGVYGFVERDGRVRTVHLYKMKKKGMQLILEKFVDKSSSIFSDEFRNYIGLSDRFKEHHVVNHGIGQYVEGENHTNTIESFWSHLKRGLTGVYHSVSKHKLFRYCYEFEFRWNTRKQNDKERFSNILNNSFGTQLTWKMATVRVRI